MAVVVFLVDAVVFLAAGAFFTGFFAGGLEAVDDFLAAVVGFATFFSLVVLLDLVVEGFLVVDGLVAVVLDFPEAGFLAAGFVFWIEVIKSCFVSAIR